MNKYEIMYILNANLAEEAIKEEETKLQGIIEAQGGQVTETKEWGVRDFAYQIKNQKKGYYVILKVSAEQACLAEFDRLARLNNNVIRHLVTIDQD